MQLILRRIPNAKMRHFDEEHHYEKGKWDLNGI